MFAARLARHGDGLLLGALPEAYKGGPMTPPTPEQLIAEARKALTDVQVFPGDRWPNARDAERALLWDCHQQRSLKQESPWEGGTLAAAKLIAASPRLLTQLADALESALRERDALADAIHPKRDASWTAEKLATLAQAHRSDSESIDAEEANGVELDAAVARVAGQLRLERDAALQRIQALEQERDRLKGAREPREGEPG
jgi:hypothetical protein